jgi:raffinose/stachyose/melibiose transport system substrate-binding protein
MRSRLFMSATAIAVVAIVGAACASGTAPTVAPTTGGATGTPAATSGGEAVELTIESWRNDDLTVWEDTIIPAFEAKYPNITVAFAPTAPTEYNAALNSKLEGGSAGDLITCRPFDASLELFSKGYLASLNDLAGMASFGDVAKSAWITDDGNDVFCVPLASVIHGFFYNTAAFDSAGLEEPTTVEEFLAALEASKQDGTYEPLAMGTKDQWEAATMGFQNIGPNYWKGEEGRQALLAGQAKFTDEPYVQTWEQLAAWRPYMPDGFESVAYPDAQQLFASARGAIYPAGSWDISFFRANGPEEFGFFGPPLPEGESQCYISDHTDIALGMNAKTAHPEEARTFLDWVASAEFAGLYSNALPGFFSLSDEAVTLEDPIAQEVVDLRKECESTIRNSYQILSRGEPNLENELWRVSAAVINGTMTAEQAAQEVQAGLDQWYEPTE